MSQAGKLQDGSVLPGIETLTGDVGGAVAGTGSPVNVDTLGTSGEILVTGNPGTSTLTWSLDGPSSHAWEVITQATEPANLSVNTGYICQAGGTGNVSVGLPLASDIGDIVSIGLNGATSWTLTQGPGQSIQVSNTTSRGGGAGSVTTTGTGDVIRLVCTLANTDWMAYSFIGNLTVV